MDLRMWITSTSLIVQSHHVLNSEEAVCEIVVFDDVYKSLDNVLMATLNGLAIPSVVINIYIYILFFIFFFLLIYARVLKLVSNI